MFKFTVLGIQSAVLSFFIDDLITSDFIFMFSGEGILVVSALFCFFISVGCCECWWSNDGLIWA